MTATADPAVRAPLDQLGADRIRYYLDRFACVPATAAQTQAWLYTTDAADPVLGPLARRLVELEAARADAAEDGAAGDEAPDGPLDMWMIIEQMGHRRLAGRVREVQVAGKGFLRIDIPGRPGRPGRTQYLSPDSVYALHPTDEPTARRTAAVLNPPEPVEQWRLTAVDAGGPDDEDDDDAWGDQHD